MLGVHAAAGRLAPHDYEQRVQAALTASTLGALRGLTADLPDLVAGRPRWTVRTVAAVVLLSAAVLGVLFVLDVAGGPAGLVDAVAALVCR